MQFWRLVDIILAYDLLMKRWFWCDPMYKYDTVMYKHFCLHVLSAHLTDTKTSVWFNPDTTGYQVPLLTYLCSSGICLSTPNLEQNRHHNVTFTVKV